MKYLRSQNVRPEEKRKKFVTRLLRSIQRVSLVILLWSLAMGAFYFVYQAVFEKAFFRLETIEVKGDLMNTDKGQIVSLLGLTEGVNLFGVDLGRLKERVLMDGWVKEVSVRRDVPHGIIIFVKEYTPAAIVQAGSLWCFVSAHGEVFKEVDRRDKKDLPVVTGLSDIGACDTKYSSKRLSEALALKKMISEDISEINISDDAGYSVVMMKDKVLLRLGFGGFEEKIQRMNKMMGAILKGGRRLKYLDMNIPGKVAVRYEM